jgi:hypothetical protein
MAAIASCVMAMGRIAQSRPGSDLSRSVAPRCATYLVDPAKVGAAGEESRCAVAGSLPAWSVDRRLPGGTHRTPGQGRAERRCICGATTALARPALRSANTSLFTTVGGPARALTARHPIKPTSPRCHFAWQPNPGRGSTYRRGKLFRQPRPPQSSAVRST